MLYPLNIFSPDPVSGSLRPFIIFLAFEVDFDMMKAKSWSDSGTMKIPRGGFVLPMPNNGLIDAVTNDYDSGGSLIAQGFSDAVGADGARIMSQTTGMVPDPKLTQTYKGTQARKWSGTWQIVPQSMGESAMVALILAFIKKAAAPDKKDVKNKVGVLIQPYVFKIVFSNPAIHLAMQFDQMAIEGYSINYFAQGYASTYKDKMPKQIELTMNFAEFGVKTRKDWM
jgi:hypothetical protein